MEASRGKRAAKQSFSDRGVMFKSQVREIDGSPAAPRSSSSESASSQAPKKTAPVKKAPETKKSTAQTAKVSASRAGASVGGGLLLAAIRDQVLKERGLPFWGLVAGSVAAAVGFVVQRHQQPRSKGIPSVNHQNVAKPEQDVKSRSQHATPLLTDKEEDDPEDVESGYDIDPLVSVDTKVNKVDSRPADTKRTLVKLRQQLRSRDELIMEMQLRMAEQEKEMEAAKARVGDLEVQLTKAGHVRVELERENARLSQEQGPYLNGGRSTLQSSGGLFLGAGMAASSRDKSSQAEKRELAEHIESLQNLRQQLREKEVQLQERSRIETALLDRERELELALEARELQLTAKERLIDGYEQERLQLMSALQEIDEQVNGGDWRKLSRPQSKSPVVKAQPASPSPGSQANELEPVLEIPESMDRPSPPWKDSPARPVSRTLFLSMSEESWQEMAGARASRAASLKNRSRQSSEMLGSGTDGDGDGDGDGTDPMEMLDDSVDRESNDEAAAAAAAAKAALQEEIEYLTAVLKARYQSLRDQSKEEREILSELQRCDENIGFMRQSLQRAGSSVDAAADDTDLEQAWDQFTEGMMLVPPSSGITSLVTAKDSQSQLPKKGVAVNMSKRRDEIVAEITQKEARVAELRRRITSLVHNGSATWQPAKVPSVPRPNSNATSSGGVPAGAGVAAQVPVAQAVSQRDRRPSGTGSLPQQLAQMQEKAEASSRDLRQLSLSLQRSSPPAPAAGGTGAEEGRDEVLSEHRANGGGAALADTCTERVTGGVARESERGRAPEGSARDGEEDNAHKKKEKKMAGQESRGRGDGAAYSSKAMDAVTGRSRDHWDGDDDDEDELVRLTAEFEASQMLQSHHDDDDARGEDDDDDDEGAVVPPAVATEESRASASPPPSVGAISSITALSEKGLVSPPAKSGEEAMSASEDDDVDEADEPRRLQSARTASSAGTWQKPRVRARAPGVVAVSNGSPHWLAGSAHADLASPAQSWAVIGNTSPFRQRSAGGGTAGPHDRVEESSPSAVCMGSPVLLMSSAAPLATNTTSAQQQQQQQQQQGPMPEQPNLSHARMSDTRTAARPPAGPPELLSSRLWKHAAPITSSGPSSSSSSSSATGAAPAPAPATAFTQSVGSGLMMMTMSKTSTAATVAFKGGQQGTERGGVLAEEEGGDSTTDQARGGRFVWMPPQSGRDSATEGSPGSEREGDPMLDEMMSVALNDMVRACSTPGSSLTASPVQSLEFYK